MTDRQAYLKMQEAQLREIAAKIEILRARAAGAEAEARIVLDRQIEELEDKKSEYLEKIGSLKQTGEEAWGDLREGVESAWKELKDGVQKAMDKFS